MVKSEFTDPDIPSLADVAEALQSRADLAPARRRDLLSAVSTARAMAQSSARRPDDNAQPGAGAPTRSTAAQLGHSQGDDRADGAREMVQPFHDPRCPAAPAPTSDGGRRWLITKFRTGQIVRIADGAPPAIPRGGYEVVRPLPWEGRDREYRVKHVSDGHERVVPERDLT